LWTTFEGQGDHAVRGGKGYGMWKPFIFIAEALLMGKEAS